MCIAFKKSSTDICSTLAMQACRLCTELFAPEGLSAFKSCRLIALDKCPGVCPIGVAEVARHILGKTILSVENWRPCAGGARDKLTTCGPSFGYFPNG